MKDFFKKYWWVIVIVVVVIAIIVTTIIMVNKKKAEEKKKKLLPQKPATPVKNANAQQAANIPAIVPEPGTPAAAETPEQIPLEDSI